MCRAPALDEFAGLPSRPTPPHCQVPSSPNPQNHRRDGPDVIQEERLLQRGPMAQATNETDPVDAEDLQDATEPAAIDPLPLTQGSARGDG